MKPDTGAALVLTLLILSFLAVIGAALLASTTLDIRLVDNYRTRVQALYLAESGIEQARELLRISGASIAQPFLMLNNAEGTCQVSLRSGGSADVWVLRSAAESGNAKQTIEAVVRKSGFPVDALDPRLNSVRELERLVRAIAANAQETFPAGSVMNGLGSPTAYSVAVVAGDATFGPGAGYGLLLVEGQLTFTGPVSWVGLIAVIGQGVIVNNADAVVQVTGGIFTARTRDISGQLLAAPESIRYDVNDRDQIVRSNASFPYALISVREN